MEGYAAQTASAQSYPGAMRDPPSTRPNLNQALDTAADIAKRMIDAVNHARRLADALSLSAEVTGLSGSKADAPEPPGIVEKLAERQEFSRQHVILLEEQLHRIERAIGVGQ